MSDEDFKFFLASQMQSFASIVLNTLLDKRFNNDSVQWHQNPVTIACQNQLIQVSSSALKNEQWALKVFDSNGRLQSGLMSGSLFNSIGNYEQCLSYGANNPQVSRIETKYCLAQIDLSRETRQLSMLTNQPRTIFAASGGRPAKLGLCIPKTCTTNDIILIANHIFSSSLSHSLSIQQLECHNDLITTVWFDNIGLMVSIALIVFVINASVSATILDSLNENQNIGRNKINRRFIKRSSGFNSFIDMFSLTRGFRKLTAKRKCSSSKLVDLRALDGLRVISMFWVITIHSYNFGFLWLLFDNIRQVDDVYKTAWTQWIANGTFSVDNFFLISGLLACYNTIAKNGPTNEPKRKISDNLTMTSLKQFPITKDTVYQAASYKPTILSLISNCCNRYLRLVPTMMIMILLSVGLLPWLAHGPNWSSSTMMFDRWCRTNWYINLLMLHNFISTPNMCFSHSWFVAVDFQLFILIQIIFFATNSISISNLKDSKILIPNMWIFSSFIIMAQIVVAFIIYLHQLPSVPLIPADSLEAILNYYSLIYIKPYYWLSSYFLGALFAIYVASLEKFDTTNKKKMKLRSRVVIIIQLTSISLMIVLLLSTVPYFKGIYKMSPLQSAIYGSVARPVWSLCTICILFFSLFQSRYMTRQNIGVKLINQTLGSHIWVPFSHVTYSAYLLHPIVIAMFYGSRTETFQFSHSLLLYFTLGNIVLTYIGALAVYLLIELPIQTAIGQINLLLISKNNSEFFIDLSSQQN